MPPLLDANRIHALARSWYWFLAIFVFDRYRSDSEMAKEQTSRSEESSWVTYRKKEWSLKKERRVYRIQYWLFFVGRKYKRYVNCIFFFMKQLFANCRAGMDLIVKWLWTMTAWFEHRAVWIIWGVWVCQFTQGSRICKFRIFKKQCATEFVKISRQKSVLQRSCFFNLFWRFT